MSEASELMLVELLIKAKHFSRDQFDELMKHRPVHEISVRSYIVNNKLVTEKQILSVLSKEQHLPIANLINCHPEPQLLSKVSLIHATTFSVFPLREEEGEIILGMVDVLDNNIFDDLRFCFNFPFKIELLSVDDHKDLITKYYTDDASGQPGDGAGMIFLGQDSEDSNGDNSDPSVNDAPVVVLLNNILI